MTRDIFLCHASEDKDEVVRPLIEACAQAGISCWYDEAEIRWGDSITQKVNDGLAMSRYVVVVFSPAFAEKHWPQRELNAVLNLEASTGEVKVLPLVVGSAAERQEILAQFPLLNDKQYLPWDGNLCGIVEALHARLGRLTDRPAEHRSPTSADIGLRIPLPKITKQFSQRDKDLFLRNAFAVVKAYFQRGLQELSAQYREIETDFSEVHNFKFVATIYVQGGVGNKCKIWLGGLMSSDAIAYHAGQFSIDSDNSFNEMLTVNDDRESLGFRPSGMWFRGRQYSEKQLLTAEQAAEHLWSMFTDSLA